MPENEKRIIVIEIHRGIYTKLDTAINDGYVDPMECNHEPSYAMSEDSNEVRSWCMYCGCLIKKGKWYLVEGSYDEMRVDKGE